MPELVRNNVASGAQEKRTCKQNHTKMFPTQALFLDRGAGHTNLMQAKWPISSAHFPFTFPAEHSWFGQFGTMHLDLAILGLDRDNRLNGPMS